MLMVGGSNLLNVLAGMPLISSKVEEVSEYVGETSVGS